MCSDVCHIGTLTSVVFSGNGYVYIYLRSGIAWTQQTKLTSNDATGLLGLSVSISADGSAVAAGIPTGQGAVIVWVRSGTTWTQQSGLLTGSDVPDAAELGYSVAISGDGKTVAAGAIKYGKGAVYIFVRTIGGNWAQQGSKLTPATTFRNALFGNSVSLSNDGNLLAIGAPLDGLGMHYT